MKNFRRLLGIIMLSLLLIACENKDGKNEVAKVNELENQENQIMSENSSLDDVDKTEDGLIEYIDDAGREVTIPAKIERIAPSGPLAQQVIMGIAPDKLVAIAQKPKGEINQKILEKFVDLPEIGQFYGKLEFNAESLASAKPDIILDIGEAKKTVVEDMDGITQKCGVPALFIEMNFEEAGEAYRKLGEILGEEERAEKLANYVDRANKEVEEGLAQIGDEKLSFVYLSGDTGLNSNPKGSFHMQMLEKLADNAFVCEEKSSKGGGNEISEEELLALDPDVIIFGPGSIYDSAKDDPVFSQLTAIKEGRYVEAPSIPYNWTGFPPSVNRYMGAQWLCKLLYPEVFDYDLKDRIVEYFDLFYGYELSDQEFESFIEKGKFI